MRQVRGRLTVLSGMSGEFRPYLLLASVVLIAGCDTAGPDSPGPPGPIALPPLEVAAPLPPAATDAPMGALDASLFGAVPGQDGRAAIQAALDAAGPGGIVTVPPATLPYLLSAISPNPFRSDGQYALRIPGGVTLHVAAGATLELAAGQQTDAAGPVDLIIFDGDDVTVTGGGAIRGNTAGQAGWSSGYHQVDAGCLIRSWRPGRRAAISDLYLSDAFSNPVNLESDGPVRLARLRTSSVGEGAQVIGASGVVVEDIEHDDLANVSEGDGLEVSVVDGFTIRRIRVTGGTSGGGGSGIDVFGSRNGSVTDVEVTGWAWGIDVHDYPSPSDTFVTDNVTIRRARFRAIAATAIVSGADQRGHVRYADIDAEGDDVGVQVFGPAGLPPLLIDSLRITGFAAGVLLYGSRDLRINRGWTRRADPLDGVLVENRSGDDAPRLQLRDFSATEAMRYGLRVEAPGLVLRIEGGDFSGNGAGPYFGLPESATVIGVTPPP